MAVVTAQRGDFERPVSGARERLAEALCASEHPPIQQTLMPVFDTGDPRNEVAACFQCQRNADALLPVVDALADERAADALEQAGEDLAPIRAGLASRVSAQAGAQAAWCANWLRDRAVALRAASRGGTTR